MTDYLDNTDQAFLDALAEAVPHPVSTLHTGGGCMVTVIDLTIDARGFGSQVWITRDDLWLLGVYDFDADPEDEGIITALYMFGASVDDPRAVADTIARYLAFWQSSFVTLHGEQTGCQS